MSRLLRRIKRSRAADAGEAPAGQAAGTEGAPMTAASAAAGDTSRAEQGTTDSGDRRDVNLYDPSAPSADAPVIHADPDRPAGLEPGTPPPSGRRGKLRRRLRYLRRARELMLRDLGGLLYEVHRTGGGDVTAHSQLIAAKVERLSSLDAEARAIESALGARRSEAVVFQPGIGGTCDACGELYGSAAHFCSNCGAPTGAVAAAPAEQRTVPPMPKAPATEAEPGAATAATGAAPTAGADADARAAGEPPAEQPAEANQAAANEPQPTADAGDATSAATRETDAATAGEGRTEELPRREMSNGRHDDRTKPGLASGDPLAARESRS
jgi:hypothetical protein